MKHTASLFATLFALALPALPAAADTVVLRDREILHGTVATDAAAKTLTVAGKTVGFDHVLLWEDTKGTPKQAATYADQLRAYEILAERRVLTDCRAAFPKAIAAASPSRASEILAQAERAGLPVTEAQQWGTQVKALAAKSPAAGTNGGSGAAATASSSSAGNRELVNLLVDRAKKTMDADQRDRGLRLLRAALELSPKDEGANALLLDVAPKYTRIGNNDKRLWLDWEVEVFSKGLRELSRHNPVMQRARSTWRKDVTGVESPEIFFITSMKDPKPVGVCVRLARLTCKSLSQVFHTDHPQRDEMMPLVVYLYSNKQEYVNNPANGAPPSAGMSLGLTLGYYSPSENISRFYWPGGPDAARSIRETFVHELTHHWIERRDPCFGFNNLDQNPMDVPGYWVVEGIAVWSQEGRYDPDKGTFSHFNPHAATLDYVVHLKAEHKLLPWSKLYPLSHTQFFSLKKKFDIPVTRRWSIGTAGFSEVNLFYEQGGATCHFLYWGENGKYRQKLVNYITAYYTGDKAGCDIQKAFGLTPDELGKKVEAFAEKVINGGWRPPSEK